MDSLLKASAAAFVEIVGTNNWNWGDLISHVEHLKTFFYHITSDWSKCDISCFILWILFIFIMKNSDCLARMPAL